MKRDYSTKLNATSKFVFRIENAAFNAEEIDLFHCMTSPAKLGAFLNLLYERGGCLKLHRIEPSSFESDLILIESSLPQILANVLIGCYRYGISDLNVLLNWLKDENPLGFDQSLGHEFYEYKLKNFVVNMALVKWPFLIVGSNLNVNELTENTKLIATSRSGRKFGITFLNKEDVLIEIGFQIEF